ncbi:MAG: S8 family serine peptidase, partial [Candidatus Thermoplasmatota archaeon]
MSHGKEKVLASLIAVLFLVPVGAVVNFGGTTELEKKIELYIDPIFKFKDTNIWLKAGVFDPLKGEFPSIRSDLKLSISNGYYIVQFNRWLTEDSKLQLKRLGVKLHSYIPTNAYIAEMDDFTKAQVLALGWVRWYDNFEPAYKIQDELLEKTGKVQVQILVFEYEMPKLPGDIGEIPEDKMPAAMKRGYIEVDGIKIPVARKFLDPSMIAGKPKIGFRELAKAFELDPKFNPQAIANLQITSFIESTGGKILWTDGNFIVAELDASYIKELAFIPYVHWIGRYEQPRRFMNLIRDYTGAEYVDDTYGFDGGELKSYLGDGLQPGTTYKIAVGDADDDVDWVSDSDCHPEFKGRVIAMQSNDNTIDDAHGTSTSGIMMAAGINEGATAFAEGMAPGSKLVFRELNLGGTGGYSEAFDTTLSNLVSGATGAGYYLAVQSNSYGTSTYDYTASSRDIDNSVRNRDVAVFWAAGNSPTVGNIDQYPIAKNVIAVGGLKDQNTADLTDDAYHTSASQGPAKSDGRIKPDLIASFEGVYTTDVRGSKGYTTTDYTDAFGGTSAASPIAASAGAVVAEGYKANSFGNNFENKWAHASLIKALMIANAYQLAWANGNRTQQGWGEVYLKRMFDLGSQHFIVNEDQHAAALPIGESYTTIVKATGTMDLKIALVWTDPGADPAATRDLVNDLDLKVTSEVTGAVYWGNYGLSSGLYSASGGSNDSKNNVECVFIKAADASGNYTVEVKHMGGTTSQNFSLVASAVASGVGNVVTQRKFYNWGDVIEVTLVDGDLNVDNTTVESATAKVFSEADSTGFTLTLNETGKDTSTFKGYVGFSMTEPFGVNDGATYDAPFNMIKVNPVDNVTISYHDISPVDTYRNATVIYDDVAPVITGLTVTDVMPTKFGLRWYTDEPATTYPIFFVVENETGYWFPATITDIRSGKAVAYLMISEEYLRCWQLTPYTNYVTTHTITPDLLWRNETVIWCIESDDEADNYALDTNGTDFYKTRTSDQPFHILAVSDDYYSLIGGIFWAYATWVAGYDWEFHDTSEQVETINGVSNANWSGSSEVISYWNQYERMKFDDYWDAFVADTRDNGTKNIVFWDTGFAAASIALYDTN